MERSLHIQVSLEAVGEKSRIRTVDGGLSRGQRSREEYLQTHHCIRISLILVTLKKYW